MSLSFGPLGFPDTRESPVVFSSTLFFLDTLSMGKSTHSYSLTMTSADNPNSSSPGTVYWHRCVWEGCAISTMERAEGPSGPAPQTVPRYYTYLRVKSLCGRLIRLEQRQIDPGFIGSETHIILGRGSSLIKKSKDLT